MKTTVEISDALLKAAKRKAEREGLTLRALLEEGLRQVLRGADTRKRFQLRRATYRGNGTLAEIREGSWDRIREAIYEGRGA